MPYWDGTSDNSEEYDIATAKLDAVIAALRHSAPVVVAGDSNYALPKMAAAALIVALHH